MTYEFDMPISAPAPPARKPIPRNWWIGGGIAVGLVSCLLCMGVGGGIVAVVGWNRAKNVSVAGKAEQMAKPDQQKKQQQQNPVPDVAPPVQLTTIYRHTARLSEAKLVKTTDPIPGGWTGGDGWRSVGIQQARWEQNLNSVLANGKEGDTAEIQH